MKRRDLLKGFATLPIAGAAIYGAIRKKKHAFTKKNLIVNELGLNAPANFRNLAVPSQDPSKTIKVGIIGIGIRSYSHMQALGYAHQDFFDNNYTDEGKTTPNGRLETFLNQDNLNVEIIGLCDVYKPHLNKGREVIENKNRPHSFAAQKTPVKIYEDYREMLANKDIDAIIITTPDFWHAQMSIDAIKAGKHVYCEKCMTRTADEAVELYDTVKASDKVFQVGHQNRQQQSYEKARVMVEKEMLGKLSFVETYTNRNTPHGAWVRNVGKEVDVNQLNWELFQGDASDAPFSTDRYYNWTKYWAYATGLSGQLFSHEFDAINQIVRMGIPESAIASGGIYKYKDGREIPDVFQASLNYPEKEFVLTYHASLINSKWREKLFLGSDATMEVGNSINLTPDKNSEKYKDLLASGAISSERPMYTYHAGLADIDALSSATEQYYAKKGLIYTYRNGKRYDLLHLHLREWIEAIREGTPVSCGIEEGFEEAIACHMATMAYRLDKKVFWDKEKRKIV